MSRTLGVDVGQARDPSALVVLEDACVVHAERLPLRTPYPAVAARVAEVEIAAGGCTVVVDVTGVGRAVADMLEARDLAPVAVTLTSGAKVRANGRELSVPRASLFTLLESAVRRGQLRIAAGCPCGAELARELLQARGGPSGAESRGAGHHGDLMTALALALWWQVVARLLPA